MYQDLKDKIELDKSLFYTDEMGEIKEYRLVNYKIEISLKNEWQNALITYGGKTTRKASERLKQHLENGGKINNLLLVVGIENIERIKVKALSTYKKSTDYNKKLLSETERKNNAKLKAQFGAKTRNNKKILNINTQIDDLLLLMSFKRYALN